MKNITLIYSKRVSGRVIHTKPGDAQKLRLQARNQNAKANKRTSSSLFSSRIDEEGDFHTHIIPLQKPGYSDAGDTIDLSKIRDESSFEIAVDDIRPSRLKVTSDELLQNSIDRFDAFGDYEYIGNMITHLMLNTHTAILKKEVLKIVVLKSYLIALI